MVSDRNGTVHFGAVGCCTVELIRCRRDNPSFQTNSEYVIKKRQNDDTSVTNSYYLPMSKDVFRERMVLDRSADTLLPPVNMNTMDKYSCNVFPVTEKVERSYPLLEEPLDSSLTYFKSSILTGLLDTMFTSFQSAFPDFSVATLSPTEV